MKDTFSYLAVLWSMAVVQAQLSNPISRPVASDKLVAGETFDVKWRPDTPGPIKLILRKGNPQNLDTVGDVVTGLANSGSYSWAVPDNIETGAHYALQIVDENDPTEFNYTPLFAIEGTERRGPEASTTSTTTTESTTTQRTTESSTESNTESTSAPETSSTTEAATTTTHTTANTTATAEAENDAATSESPTTILSGKSTTSATSKPSVKQASNGAHAAGSPSTLAIAVLALYLFA